MTSWRRGFLWTIGLKDLRILLADTTQQTITVSQMSDFNWRELGLFRRKNVFVKNWTCLVFIGKYKHMLNVVNYQWFHYYFSLSISGCQCLKKIYTGIPFPFPLAFISTPRSERTGRTLIHDQIKYSTCDERSRDPHPGGHPQRKNRPVRTVNPQELPLETPRGSPKNRNHLIS